MLHFNQFIKRNKIFDIFVTLNSERKEQFFLWCMILKLEQFKSLFRYCTPFSKIFSAIMIV